MCVRAHVRAYLSVGVYLTNLSFLIALLGCDMHTITEFSSCALKRS